MRKLWLVVVYLLLPAALLCGAEPPPARPAVRPVEKPVTLRFEELRFADEQVQQQAQRFHQWGEALANSTGKKLLYERSRSSPQSQWSEYTAWWQSQGNQQGLAIICEGPRRDQMDQLHTVRVRGSWRPGLGRGAEVHYGSAYKLPTPVPQSLSVMVSGMLADMPQSISLTTLSVSARVPDTPGIRYDFDDHYVPARDFAATVKLFFSTPEALRDGLLEDLAAFRRQTEQRLAAGDVMIYDSRNARSDEPARRMPIFDRTQLPKPATQKELARQVGEQLDALEKTLRADFREIHAAVHQALPLAELLVADTTDDDRP